MTKIRHDERTPIIDDWGPGTLTPPDEPRDEWWICHGCGEELDLSGEHEYYPIRDFDGEEVMICEECAIKEGLV